MAINKEQAMVIVDVMGKDVAYAMYIDCWQIAQGKKTNDKLTAEDAAGLWPGLEEALVERGIVDRYNDKDYTEPNQ